MTRSTPEAVGGIALLTAALFGLLALSERAGLPLSWVKTLLGVLACLAFLLVLSIGRTTREKTFLGQNAATHPLLAGIALGATSSFAAEAFVVPADGSGWLATLLGVAAGVISGHLLARRVHHKPLQSDPVARASAVADPFGGLGLALVGFTLLLGALAIAAPETARLVDVSPMSSAVIIVMLASVTVLAGGAQGVAISSAACSTAAVTAVLALLAVSGATLGPLPLPGQSDAGTLEAIETARKSWLVERPLHFTTWPSLAAAFSGTNLRSFIFAALLAGGIGLALSPAFPIARRTTVVAGTLTALLLPVAFVALGGYAIEAAAVRFIGAPIARPPASLAEATELGLATACGVRAATTEAIRTACGISPRDTATFTWQQIRLLPPFLEGGYAVILGLSSAFSIAASAIKLLLSLGLATLGLWLAAKGLGREILARHHTAAGLASLRLGHTRLACALFAGAALFLWIAGVMPTREVLVFLATAGAFLVMVATLLKLRRVPQPATPDGPVKRRRKPVPSPQGEPA